MTKLLNRPTEQRFIQTNVSWKDFKAIQSGFANSPGVRVFYYKGELEILSTSPEHEIVKGNLGDLVETYMLESSIDFVATGSFTQEVAEEASAQADESYCFGEPKSIPDLSIEVVISSGGPDKLRRYGALGVAEVWFWEDGEISVYRLVDGEYCQIDQSGFLPELDLALLARYAAISSRRNAVKEFRK